MNESTVQDQSETDPRPKIENASPIVYRKALDNTYRAATVRLANGPNPGDTIELHYGDAIQPDETEVAFRERLRIGLAEAIAECVILDQWGSRAAPITPEQAKRAHENYLRLSANSPIEGPTPWRPVFSPKEG